MNAVSGWGLGATLTEPRKYKSIYCIDTSVRPRQNEEAKRGRILAATLLTWSCFPNVDSFCHARNICVRHTFCVLDTKIVSENLQKHLLCPRGAEQCCRVLPRAGNIAEHNVAAAMCLRFEKVGKYAARKTRTELYPGPEWHIFSILTSEDIGDDDQPSLCRFVWTSWGISSSAVSRRYRTRSWTTSSPYWWAVSWRPTTTPYSRYGTHTPCGHTPSLSNLGSRDAPCLRVHSLRSGSPGLQSNCQAHGTTPGLRMKKFRVEDATQATKFTSEQKGRKSCENL